MKRHIIPAPGVRLMSAWEHFDLMNDLGDAAYARLTDTENRLIKPGDEVLLCVVTPDRCELCGVVVIAVNGTSMTGTCGYLCPEKLNAEHGDEVTFERQHVLAIIKGPSQPDPPRCSRCVVE